MQAHPRAGELVTTSSVGEIVRAFVPKPLPPVPPLALTEDDRELIDRANRALGRLDGLGMMLPDTHLFVYLYIRKEAVLSSQIEGTQSSLSDLLLHESEQVPGVPIDDVVEVSNYVAAISHGLERMRGGFPLSLRLIKEMHEVLLSKGRGSTKQPGLFRTSQNWIGGARPGVAAFVRVKAARHGGAAPPLGCAPQDPAGRRNIRCPVPAISTVSRSTFGSQ